MAEKVQRKFPTWSLTPSVCSVCFKESETTDYMFLHCPFVQLVCSLLITFDLAGFLSDKVNSWMAECVRGKIFRDKPRIPWGRVVSAVFEGEEH